MKRLPRYVTYRQLEDASEPSGISHLPTHIWAKFEDEPDCVKLPCMSLSVGYKLNSREPVSWLHCAFDPATEVLMHRAHKTKRALLFGTETGCSRMLFRARVMQIKHPAALPAQIALADYRIKAGPIVRLEQGTP
jgi:hypothetical protein